MRVVPVGLRPFMLGLVVVSMRVGVGVTALDIAMTMLVIMGMGMWMLVGCHIELHGSMDRQQNRSSETGLSGWSGRRESNPRMQLGKLPFYH